MVLRRIAALKKKIARSFYQLGLLTPPLHTARFVGSLSQAGRHEHGGPNVRPSAKLAAAAAIAICGCDAIRSPVVPAPCTCGSGPLGPVVSGRPPKPRKPPAPLPPAAGERALSDAQRAVLEAGRQSLTRGDAEECLGQVIGGMNGAGHAFGYLLLAQCKAELDLLIEARIDAERAATMAAGDAELVGQAASYAQEIDADIPRLHLLLEPGVELSRLAVDRVPLPDEQLHGKELTIEHNPGDGSVEAAGRRRGDPWIVAPSMPCYRTVRLERGDRMDFPLYCCATPEQVCMFLARDSDERKKCVVKCCG